MKFTRRHQQRSPRTGLPVVLVVLLFLTPGWSPLAPAQENEAPGMDVAVDTNVVTEVGGDQTVENPVPAVPEPVRNGGERVSVGGSLTVREDEAVREAVAVFGSSKVAGTVTREMVTVFGDADLSGKVEREMVTVFGRSKMNGSVSREMVTVFGDAEVNGPVGRECVTVFGNLTLGPNAKVGRECVAVFGKVNRDPDAELAQEPVEVLPFFSGLGTWMTDGLLLGRLIPPSSRLAWIVVGLHLLLYGLIALLLPRPVKACAEPLTSRPWLTFGVGLLVIILLAPLYLILTAIGVGVVVVPFIGLAETAFVCLGKTAAMEVIGFQIFRGFGRKTDGAPLVAFFLGFALITLLYMVPVLGLLVWLIFRPVALGAATMACFAGMRRNGDGNGHAPGIPVAPPVSPAMNAAASSAGPRTEAPHPGVERPATAALPPLEAAVMPRAGFWIRIVAVGLDFIALCWILMLPHLDSFFLFFWLAYHIGMWAWRGTTIGGIVCNLKLVRVDGQKPDASVCLVRGLASLFSALPLFLGFFWAGWTSDRQSWHDKIAGTVIVRVPKGIPLI